MRTIMISDVTMQQTVEAGGILLSFREKIELAKLLDKLGASVIELSPIENPRSDRLLIKSIASAVKDSIVAVPVSVTEDNTAFTWDALTQAAHPRLQVCLPVSDVQMEYFLHKKADAVPTFIAEKIAACAAICSDVEFVAQDATRADEAFLAHALEAAAQAGATLITIKDDAGAMLVEEFGAFIARIRAALPENVRLGVACSNALFMADANSIAAIQAGACEVKASANATFTASLPNIARVIDTKGSSFGVASGVRTVELDRIVKQIAWMCETQRSDNSPFDNGVRDNGDEATFTAHDSIEEVARAIEAMGYDLPEEDITKVYDAFCQLAARKDTISATELDAIVATEALQVPQTFKLESFVINSGNTIMATSHMRLRRDGEILDSVALGDGPVDASFLAIEQIVGHHYELDDFKIRAVTEGREALGETVIRLRADDGRVYSGRGLSTDVIGSSILAYISAVNKIVYEEAGE
ncbi:MAG: hypothetical protein E7003_03060 [Eggerthellaceae bacterium]|nr:hypothetical protein [Eggerthellaceae bacterium]